MTSPSSSLSPPSPQPPDPPTSPSMSSLDTLIPHLLASKRSLACINQVQRANDLCTSTRTHLEQSAVTVARTSFLRSGIASQLHLLEEVHQNTSTAASQIKSEFESVMRRLDEADVRLRAILDDLRNTSVAAKLRPEGEETKHLLDFVDEGGVEGLNRAVKDLLDGAGDGMKESSKENKQFNEEVRKVRRILNSKEETTGQEQAGISREHKLPNILHEMEDHARGMAAHLESLVSHFDLCVTAIKHIEGGGDAALRIAGDLPEGVGMAQDAVTAPEPIGDEEWANMIRVLEEDSGQVDEVVMEIRDHIAELEALYEHVEAHTKRLAKEHAFTTAAFRLLEEIGVKLPGYATQSQIFLVHWAEDKEKIEERLEELEAVREFYTGFLRAYDSLLIEVGRRKAWEVKMEKMVQETRSQLQKIYEDDVEEREAFAKDQGHFLPMDIWPDLAAGPLRFEISPVEGSAARVPDISKSVIYRAIKRIHGKR